MFENRWCSPLIGRAPPAAARCGLALATAPWAGAENEELDHDVGVERRASSLRSHRLVIRSGRLCCTGFSAATPWAVAVTIATMHLLHDPVVERALRQWVDELPPVNRPSVAGERDTLVEHLAADRAGQHEPVAALRCVVERCTFVGAFQE